MSVYKRSIRMGILFAALICFAQAHAQVGFGFNARGGLYTENSDFFLGGGVDIKFVMLNVEPNIEYVFIDGGDMYDLNLDVKFNLLSVPMTSIWFGGGLAQVFVKPEGGDTNSNTGVNILAGAGLNAIVLKPFVQAKYIVIEGSDQFVIGVGLRL